MVKSISNITQSFFFNLKQLDTGSLAFTLTYKMF